MGKATFRNLMERFSWFNFPRRKWKLNESKYNPVKLRILSMREIFGGYKTRSIPFSCFMQRHYSPPSALFTIKRILQLRMNFFSYNSLWIWTPYWKPESSYVESHSELSKIHATESVRRKVFRHCVNFGEIFLTLCHIYRVDKSNSLEGL